MGTAIDVAAETRRGARAGIRFHSCVLAPEDKTTRDGLPLTSVPRTLLDLAATLDPTPLRRAIDRAELLRLFDLTAVAELLDRSTGQRGAGRLRRALHAGAVPTANELEDAMLAICARARLPAPRVNEWVALPSGGGLRPDFLWPDHRVAVETDGYETHGTRHAFGADRARDRRLKVETGIETYRFTWQEVMLEPKRVGRELRDLLARAESNGASHPGTLHDIRR